MKKVIIIGAGISGLAAGWYHKQKGHDVTILEKSGRVGGWLRSSMHDGFLFENGPRGFRSIGKGKRTLELVNELGLEKELIAADTNARKRYLGLNGKLRTPNLFLMLQKGLVWALLNDLCSSPIKKEDETIGDFSRRRLNKKITETFLDPIVKGIFGGDLNELSVRSCFPTLWEAGSFIRCPREEKANLFSFKNGMETLPKALAEHLDVQLNTPVIGIEKEGVILKDRTLEADHIIAAVPAYALTPHDPFTYATLTTVSLGWNKPLLRKKGFGFLIPASKVMGMTWDSTIFPEQNVGEQTRVCVMIQGSGTLDMALETVQKYLGIDTPPDARLVSRAERAIPQYILGHHKRLKHFEKQIPAELIGNCYTGVGVNDCIEAAWQSAS